MRQPCSALVGRSYDIAGSRQVAARTVWAAWLTCELSHLEADWALGGTPALSSLSPVLSCWTGASAAADALAGVHVPFID